jgi:hypothetical protein
MAYAYEDPSADRNIARRLQLGLLSAVIDAAFSVCGIVDRSSD